MVKIKEYMNSYGLNWVNSNIIKITVHVTITTQSETAFIVLIQFPK